MYLKGTSVKNNHQPPSGGFFLSGALMIDQHRIAELEKQMAASTARADNFEKCMADMRAELTENTTTTKQIAADTAFIRGAWADGVAVVHFGCRLAAAWRFLLRQVFVPVVLPIGVLYGLWCIHDGRTVPAPLGELFHLLAASL